MQSQIGQYNRICSKFYKKNILVIGDIILDRYIQGSVSRISPEAPVPIVVEESSFYTPGGAANVAKNLRGLGAKVTLIGRIGKDSQGQILRRLLRKGRIDIRGIFTDKGVPTICKTRVVVQRQQVVRIDREKIKISVNKEFNHKIHHFIENNIKSFDALIISDYGKGLITPELVSFLRQQALAHKKIITVDPKVEHFSYYRNVTAITPNLKEAENAIRDIKVTSKTPGQLGIHSDRLKGSKEINLAGKELLRYLELDALLITLGEQGIRLFEKWKKPVLIKTKAREVYDVTGAGDAVISTFTLSLTAGATKSQAAEIANYAAGIVVGKMGAVAVSREELLKAIEDH
ncbi:MAG: D-glycero-beta-D-manno-heptose-7-phosphate kinase [Candidatus Omnitrophica bacterium]|nr:D-glycero-beta-D-manno-heptose-7-phosphate kinase [Candidatus Omnitrophota bacterium]